MLEPTKKDTLHFQEIRGHKMVGRAKTLLYQIPFLLDGQPMTWKAVIPQKLSHCSEG